MFNPGILRHGKGWIFAYRVVLSDLVRRIAICKLNGDFHVCEGSEVPFTDLIRFRAGGGYSEFALSWFADPASSESENACSFTGTPVGMTRSTTNSFRNSIPIPSIRAHNLESCILSANGNKSRKTGHFSETDPATRSTR